ncbi:MAG: AAA ATPase central domain-containing protein [Candidatus Moranbacteria bacterium GW2011_GWE1_35_17]|nr:MAG: AAA ATPase central domain-containing protein [Candidatus Moranbacteria bacterium GW2011_GWE1_35_17]
MKITKKAELAGVALLLAVFILPIISWASGTKEIFVDDDASGTQDGSFGHPYKTISKAIEKANGKTKIIVGKGVYIENIVVSDNIKISGKDKKKSILKAESKSAPAVTLENKTEITDLTIEGGKNGVLIKDTGKGEITISDCLIRDAKGDGIKIENGNKSSDRKVNIINNKIYENKKSGIYSERRRLVIIDNEIFDNELDGIDMEKSVQAYIENNEINQNDGVGVKLRLDKSDITITKNNFYKNDKDGLEVRYDGVAGWASIKKNNFSKNDRFGIAKIFKDSAENLNFAGLTIENNNSFSENKNGRISNPIRN